MYKFIKTAGKEAKTIGYLVSPILYGLHGIRIGLRIFGFDYLRYILKGEKIWWTDNEDDYVKAIEDLKELKKTHAFDFYYIDDVYYRT